MILELRANRTRTQAFRRHSSSYHPAIYPLEARHLLTTFFVDNAADSGPGSLRQAIEDANTAAGPDAIEFQIADETILLSGGQLVITDDLTINGPGADKLTIQGSGHRVLAIVPEAFASDLRCTSPPISMGPTQVVKLAKNWFCPNWKTHRTRHRRRRFSATYFAEHETQRCRFNQ